MDYLKSFWYYDETIHILRSEILVIKVPEMNTTETRITYPTRLVMGHNYNRMETYMKTEYVNRHTSGFDLFFPLLSTILKKEISKNIKWSCFLISEKKQKKPNRNYLENLRLEHGWVVITFQK